MTSEQRDMIDSWYYSDVNMPSSRTAAKKDYADYLDNLQYLHDAERGEWSVSDLDPGEESFVDYVLNCKTAIK